MRNTEIRQINLIYTALYRISKINKLHINQTYKKTAFSQYQVVIDVVNKYNFIIEITTNI